MKTSSKFEEQVAELRRSHILEAAAEVFAEKGFRQATIKDIAQRAGLADGTIYNYFENKRNLLFCVLDSIENPVLETLTQITTPMELEQLIRYLVEDGQVFLETHGKLLVSILAEVLFDVELRAEFTAHIIQPRFALLQRHLEQSKDFTAPSEEQIIILSRTIVGAVVTNLLLNQVHLESNPIAINPDVLIDLLSTWFANGVKSSPGRE